MSLKYNQIDNYFVLHNKFKINCNIIENIITNKYINNYDNFIENNNIWFIKCKNKLIYLGKIFFPNYIFNDIKHINSDYTDFRKKNIIFIENYSIKLDNDNYKIIKKGTPYYISKGKFSGQYRNMYWYVKDKTDNTKYYIMDCKNYYGNIEYFKFSKKSRHKVLKIGNCRNVWYIGKNGYVTTTFKENNKRKIRYLHQHLLDHYGHTIKKGNLTVDHINRNKLDNRPSNLWVFKDQISHFRTHVYDWKKTGNW